MEIEELGIVVRRGGEAVSSTPPLPCETASSPSPATGNLLAILRGVPALNYTFHRIYFSRGSLPWESVKLSLKL